MPNKTISTVDGRRVRVGDYNLKESQAVTVPADLKNEILIVQSSSLPVWGSSFTIPILEKNITLNNVRLSFTTSAVTGTSIVGAFNPAFFFFTRIEILQGGNVIDTVYNSENFIRNQLMHADQDRIQINNSAGAYSSATQRALLSSTTTTNNHIVNLQCYINQVKGTVLTDAHGLTLRVYMDSLANVYNVTSGTLTSANILSCTAICNVTRLSPASIAQRMSNLSAYPQHSIFHEMRNGTYTIPSGVTTTSVVLSSLSGKSAGILFTVRASTVNAGAFNHLAIASFNLLGSDGASLVGGTPIPANLAVLYNTKVCQSSYNSEVTLSSNNQNANFYYWAFSIDTLNAMKYGRALSSRTLLGNETLTLTFASALGSAHTLDVYSYTESILERTMSNVRKTAL